MPEQSNATISISQIFAPVTSLALVIGAVFSIALFGRGELQQVRKDMEHERARLHMQLMREMEYHRNLPQHEGAAAQTALEKVTALLLDAQHRIGNLEKEIIRLEYKRTGGQ